MSTGGLVRVFLIIQVIGLIDRGFRLPPPPGCPRGVYTIMTKCWLVKYHIMTNLLLATTFFRHPNKSERPTFSDIRKHLWLPGARLLQWSEEDRSISPEAAELGADLLHGKELYRDLQTQYN
jgi:hypothetical protein